MFLISAKNCQKVLKKPCKSQNDQKMGKKKGVESKTFNVSF